MRSINPFYLQQDMQNTISAAFKEQRMVAIQEFLTDAAYTAAAKSCERGWKRVDIPNRHKYELRGRMPIQSEVKLFVKQLTGKIPLSEDNRRFSRGDYTILHDHDVQPAGILAFLFMEDWKEEYGGKIVLMKNGKTIASFVPRRNSLLILERKKGVRYFIKYVNHTAGKKKLTILSA